MRAVTRHIEGVPEEWQSTNDWDSHRPLLWLASTKFNGICEVGMGDGSTPLLVKWLNEKPTNRFLISAENNDDWSSKYLDGYDLKFVDLEWCYHQKGNHMVHKCKDIFDFNGGGDIIFVDCAPGIARKKIIERNKDAYKVILVHDTESGADYVYQMSEILSAFKYRLDYQPEGKPHTTAVSNTVNVCSWI